MWRRKSGRTAFQFYIHVKLARFYPVLSKVTIFDRRIDNGVDFEFQPAMPWLDPLLAGISAVCCLSCS